MLNRMVPVKKITHKTRNTDYEIIVYMVQITGEHRICVFKGGFGVGDFFEASQEVFKDAKIIGINIVEDLISVAIDDINRNEFGLY